jgi:hypothetical protein
MISSHTTGTNTSATFFGTDVLTMSWFGNYSASRTWDVALFVTVSTMASTGYFTHGAALATLDMATGGNGIHVRSISVT